MAKTPAKKSSTSKQTSIMSFFKSPNPKTLTPMKRGVEVLNVPSDLAKELIPNASSNVKNANENDVIRQGKAGLASKKKSSEENEDSDDDVVQRCKSKATKRIRCDEENDENDDPMDVSNDLNDAIDDSDGEVVATPNRNLSSFTFSPSSQGDVSEKSGFGTPKSIASSFKSPSPGASTYKSGFTTPSKSPSGLLASNSDKKNVLMY